MSTGGTAVVLSGGGAYGAFQVGMLDSLVNDLGINFDIIRGVSVGALNGAVLAQAANKPDSLGNLSLAVSDLGRLWKTIKGNRSVYRKRWTRESRYDNTPLQKLMNQHLDVNRMQESGRDFAVGVVDLVDGSYMERKPASSGFLQDILASTVMPFFFPPVWNESNEQILVDGGVREITPLSSVFRARPSEIYVLLTSRVETRTDRLPEDTKFPGEYKDWVDTRKRSNSLVTTILKRSVAIMLNEIFLDDIRGALEWNSILESARALLDALDGDSSLSDAVEQAKKGFHKALKNAGKHYVPIHVIAPHVWYDTPRIQSPGLFRFPVPDSLNFDPHLIRKAIRHGREIGRDRSRWAWSSLPASQDSV